MDKKHLTLLQKEISEKYRNGSKAGRFMGDPIGSKDHALAYAIARMPATAAVLKGIFDGLYQKGFVPKTILDLGAGTGAACQALLQVYDGLFSKVSIDAIEKNRHMRAVAEEFFSQEVSFLWHSHMSAVTGTSYDLVIASYILSELSEGDALSAALNLWEKTESFFVMADTGTPYGFKRLARIRQYLIEKGAFIVAPCSHEKNCPLLEKEDDWCHFKVKTKRGDAHKAIKEGQLNWEIEKYTYLVASKKPEALLGDRIIKNPLRSSGMIQFDLCGKDGITRRTFTRKDGEKYRMIKKQDWGDILPFSLDKNHEHT